MSHADETTNRSINHDAALKLLLSCCVACHFIALCIEENATISLHFFLRNVKGRASSTVSASSRVEMSISSIRAVEATIGREVHIHTVVIVGRSLKKPRSEVVACPHAQSGEGSVAHAHAFSHNTQGHGLFRYRIHHGVKFLQFHGIHTLIAHLSIRIVIVVGIAHRSHHIKG